MKKSYVIPVDKSRMKFVFWASLVFVAAGILFFAGYLGEQTKYPPLYFKVLGIFSISFFVLTLINSFLNLLKKDSGLIIDNEGIRNTNAGNFSYFIPWRDIENIKKTKVRSIQYLLIFLKEPEQFIKQSKNPIQKFFFKFNLKSYKTPVTLSANILDCSYEQLEEIVRKEFNKRTHQR